MIGAGVTVRSGAIIYAEAEIGVNSLVGHHTLLRTRRHLMQDFVPSMVAALYEHLLTEGRQKRNTNGEMHELWKAAQAADLEIRPREIADKVGVTYAAARRGVRRYEVGRIPKPYEPRLSPTTVKSVYIMLSSAMSVAVVWKYITLTDPEREGAIGPEAEPRHMDS